MMNPIIQTEELRYLHIQYPSIALQAKQATFICGESGCGKTSLLKLLNGVMSADGGTVAYQGMNIAEYNPVELRREVLLCGQRVYLFHQTIGENFDTFYDYREIPHLDSEQKKEFLRACCIDFPLDSPCTNLSGGEQQRVFLSICLSFQPKVLMLDEPTASLDGQTADCLINNLKEYCHNATITLLIVCHDKSLAKKYANQIIFLEGGTAI